MFRNEQRQSPEQLDPQLAAMFAAYRDATPDPEPSPGFQPELWRRIEARQTFAFSLKRLAQGILTAAAAVSLAMGLFLSQNTAPYPASYVEILAADQGQPDADVLQVDFTTAERAR